MSNSLYAAAKAALDYLADDCEAQWSPEQRAVVEVLREATKNPEPKLGPLAIAMDGGLVQNVCSDDPRLIGNISILVIDYDTDGAETVYHVPQVDKQIPALVSEAQLYETVCSPADGIKLAETWRRYMNDEVTLECAIVNAEADGYKVRLVPGSSDRWEWYTDEAAVSFVDYEDADAAWMAAYLDIVQ